MKTPSYSLNKIHRQRRKFKPGKIEVLFIAESPPIRGNFFYDPNSLIYDHLFRNIMDELFVNFQPYAPTYNSKLHFLNCFMNNGYYLVDATNTPVNNQTIAQRNIVIKRGLNRKIGQIRNLLRSNINAPVVILKQNVFCILYPALIQAGFNVVHHSPIPFPSSGQQQKFKIEFIPICQNLGIYKKKC